MGVLTPRSSSTSGSTPRGGTDAGTYVTMDPKILREQFDSFDKDGSGYLEPAEAAAALIAIGSKLSFKDLDTDGDQRISFEEFSVRTHSCFPGRSPCPSRAAGLQPCTRMHPCRIFAQPVRVFPLPSVPPSPT